ncbi:MFS transporter [Spiroplasma gladiatoris]|uniref:MFS transporter n=1 Tax=Spiroplasma gladiatoris TaxID=2143 RepID=A0A4P7AI60_9MOLU|nr:hypothetical protein [Spiroplasma gladiatoris]QBQ08154.1 MFS transporter [Spiroplasma gladiatoris]
MENNRVKLIFKITISALLSSFLTILNLLFSFVPGLDVSFLMLALLSLMMTWDIAFFVTLTTSALAFLYKIPIFDGVSFLLTNLLTFVIFFSLRKMLLKNKWSIFLLLLIISTLYDTFIFLLWLVISDLQNATAMYISKTAEMHIIFVVYLFLPIITFKKLEIVLFKISSKYSFIINRNYLDYWDKEEIEKMKKYSDKKSNYVAQLISLIISMNILMSFLAFLPFLINNYYGYKYILLLIILPIVMLIMTPQWMKLKKKTNNKLVLTHNCVGLIVALTFVFLGMMLKNYNLALSLMILGIILFGVFIAGFIPMNIEILKSYKFRNGQKNNVNKIITMSSFVLIPFPFLLENFTKSVYTMTLYLFLILIVLFILCLNRNIMSDGNVLKVSKEDFRDAFKNKKFLSISLTQSIFIGLEKFLEYGLIFFFFISFTNKNLTLEFFQPRIYLFIFCGFLLKHVGRAAGYLFKWKNSNNIKINYLSNVMFMMTFLVIFTFTLVALFISFNNINLVYKLIIIFSQFVMGLAYILLKRSQDRVYKNMLNEKGINGAFILDHLNGNVLYSLTTYILFAVFFVAIPFNIYTFIALNSILLLTSTVVTISNLIIKK